MWTLCLASFSWHVFEVHPCCNTYWYFILFMAEQYSIVWLYQNMCIYSSPGGHLDCFYLLTIVKNAAMNVLHRNLCEQLFSILLGKYLRVELLDHLVLLRLAFWGTEKLFSIAVGQFYISTNNVWAFQFLDILTKTCYFPLKYIYIAILVVWSSVSLWFWLAFP